MEVQRDHVLQRKVNDEGDIFAAEEDLLNQAQASEAASADEALMPFQALGSQAVFDRVLYDGGEFGHSGEVQVGSEEEMDFLGIPGLLEADQVRDLLHHRQSERARQQRRTSSTPEDVVRDVSTHEQLAVLRLAERAGGRVEPHRPAARRHPRGAATRVREPAAAGHHRIICHPDRTDPGLGGAQSSLSILGAWQRDLADPRPGLRVLDVLRTRPAAERHRARRGGRREPHRGPPARRDPGATRSGPPRHGRQLHVGLGVLSARPPAAGCASWRAVLRDARRSSEPPRT
jgi:hypothetical protein